MTDKPEALEYTSPAPNWRHYAVCGSTNDIAREWAQDPEDPAPDGAVVTADYQTRGRGRRGRTWSAEPGENLLMTIVCRTGSVEWLWAAAAVAAASVVAGCGLNPRIKWPNDILIGAGKAGGILVESVLAVNGGEALGIIGVGLNINQTQFDVDPSAPYPPISLMTEKGIRFDVREIADGLDLELRNSRALLRDLGSAALVAALRDRLAVGAWVQRGSESARLQNIEDSGAAVVSLEDGTFAVWRTVDGGGMSSAALNARENP